MRISVERAIRSLPRQQEGQTMAEYGVVLAILTVGAVAAFTALEGGIESAINRIASWLPT